MYITLDSPVDLFQPYPSMEVCALGCVPTGPRSLSGPPPQFAAFLFRCLDKH